MPLSPFLVTFWFYFLLRKQLLSNRLRWQTSCCPASVWAHMTMTVCGAMPSSDKDLLLAIEQNREERKRRYFCFVTFIFVFLSGWFLLRLRSWESPVFAGFLLISYIIEQYVVTSLHDHQDGAWVNSKELADNNRPIIGVASVEKCFLYSIS